MGRKPRRAPSATLRARKGAEVAWRPPPLRMSAGLCGRSRWGYLRICAADLLYTGRPRGRRRRSGTRPKSRGKARPEIWPHSELKFGRRRVQSALSDMAAPNFAVPIGPGQQALTVGFHQVSSKPELCEAEYGQLLERPSPPEFGAVFQTHLFDQLQREINLRLREVGAPRDPKIRLRRVPP